METWLRNQREHDGSKRKAIETNRNWRKQMETGRRISRSFFRRFVRSFPRVSHAGRDAESLTEAARTF